MLKRAFGKMPELNEYTKRIAIPKEDFTDIPKWAETELADVFDAGIVAGTSEGVFSPDENVTDTQMDLFIKRTYAVFGSNLKELRLKHKMTQKELADKIGVTKSVISYYELQERSPSPEILIKLSRIFHVTTDYLLGIEHTHTIDVSNLSSEQLTVIEQLIKLFENDDK